MSKSIIFIDSYVTGYETLIAELAAGIEWFLLNAQEDGLGQMQRTLANYRSLDSIQVISHGSAGALYLGSTVLNSDNLYSYESKLKAIGSSLSATGDVLLYGCNVAQGDVGMHFISVLAQATGADVAASSNATGDRILGGDAVLEQVSGNVEAASLALKGLTGLLTVNTAPVFHDASQRTGKAVIDIGTPFNEGLISTIDYGGSLTLQANGKILVAGFSYIDNTLTRTDFSVIRLNANGTLDTAFSGDGKATFDVGGYDGYDRGHSLSVQADGKILIAGYSSFDDNFAVIRLNADGTLDTSFSDDGKATFHLGGSGEFGQSLRVQADDKILIAGHSNSGYENGYYNFGVIRLNADGTLDITFSGDGKAAFDFDGYFDYGQSLSVQADGKILVAGYSYTDYNFTNSDFSVIQLNADGTLDITFSGDGKATFDVGGSYDYGHSLTVQADGKILVAGSSYTDSSSTSSNFSVIRLNADGTLDTTFSSDGKATFDIGGFSDDGQSLSVQADGKILLAGSSTTSSGYSEFCVIRLNVDGTLDPTFSNDGKATFDIGGSNNIGTSLRVQADGKIVVAGTSGTDFGVIRINADGTLDTTFGALASETPASTLGGTVAYIEGAAATGLDASVVIYDAELAALNGGAGNYSGASVTLSRNGGAATQDVFSGKGNLSLSGTQAVLSGVALGTLSNTAGTLSITFNANATQARVNEALSSIGYVNSSHAPASSVQVEWVFSDGSSTNAQGTGGALTVTDSTTVNITAINDLPMGSVTITCTATQGQTLTAANTLTDLDGLGAISYQWSAGGSAIAGATSGTLVLGQAQVGKAITVAASYTDALGTAERVASSATTAVVTNIPPQVITGTGAGDTLTGGAGNDTFDGGAGTDTAVFSSLLAAYSFAPSGGNQSLTGPDGSDTLSSIERLTFADANLAFDLDGNAGQTYRLYQAAFNRTPDIGGLGGWIAGRDSGLTPIQVANSFMASAEFQSLYGANPSNEQFVSLLYTNALHRPADAGSLGYWINQLSSGLQTRAQALVNFSESPENKAAVLPSIANGILYANASQAGGLAKGQSFTGAASDDTFIGTVGNDTFNGGAGNDSINGGAGLDVAVYGGNRASHTITVGASLSVSGSVDGTDTLTNVERIKFDDTALAFDTSGNAGQTYRLYQAAFNRTPDKGGLSDWIRGMDTGMSLQKVASGFVGSAEFKGLMGSNSSDTQFVDLMYANVLHRAPDQSGYDYWLGQMHDGTTRETVLIGFSESPENQAALIGVIQGGIEYVAV